MLFHATGRSAFHPHNAPRHCSCKSHRLEETFLLAMAIDTAVSVAVSPLPLTPTLRYGKEISCHLVSESCVVYEKRRDFVTYVYLRDRIYEIRIRITYQW